MGLNMPGLNAMVIWGPPALLVKVTAFCTAVSMHPSGVASVAVMLMF
jgi:hypothetical protein